MTDSKLAVLIPAFKINYIDEVFEGLKHQTFKKFDVYVSDDSPSEVISSHVLMLQQLGNLDGLNVQVRKGPKNARLNLLELDAAYAKNYDYVHFHLDDDYIFPTFYETHLHAHMRGDFSTSISSRWYSDETNRPIPRSFGVSFGDGNFLFNPMSIEVLAKSTLPNSINWLGELSNAVFKISSNPIFPLPPCSVEDLNYFGLPDMGAFFNSAQNRDLIYIRDHLSCFRQHKLQTTHEVGTHGIRVAVLCWLAYAIKAHNDHLIDDTDFLKAVSRQKARLNFRRGEDNFFEVPLRILSTESDLNSLKHKYLEFWASFLEPLREKMIMRTRDKFIDFNSLE